MKLTRRRFMQISGTAAAGLAAANLGFDVTKARAHTQMLKTRYAKQTTSICCYCAVGCGLLVHTSKKGDGRVMNVEGDPDHVINRGSICSKAAAVSQLAENENRLTTPMYRPAYSKEWKKVSWDWALSQITKKAKQTRDKTFTPKNDKGQTVNRTTQIASVGSAALDNEECWIYQALMRALGLTYIEHQARI